MALRDILVAFNVTVDQRQLVEAQRNVSALIQRFQMLQRVASFALGSLGVGKLTASADEYLVLENKLKAVTEGTEQFVVAQKGVEGIADALAQPVSDVADSFLRYQLATESLGRSQEEVLDFTKRVTQAMILSGATSQEAHRAAVQLAQGFGKDFKAAAQDLKSVKEQAPVLAKIIEKAAGVLPGQLLVAAKAGKINSKLVFDAVRAQGAALDEEFAQRQKTFAEIGNLLSNQWLQLIKRLRPAFTTIITLLERVVGRVREWVKDGSAINSFVAAITMLTAAFGYLAASVALTYAPLLGLFLLLEDFVGFIRGDESVTGDIFENWIGKNQTERFRQGIQELIDLVGKFFAALGGGPEAEMAAWRFERAMKNAIDRVWAYAREQLLAFARREAGVNPVGPQKQTVEDVDQFRKDHPIVNWIADVTGFKEEIRARRQQAGLDPDTLRPLGTAGGGMVGDEPLAPTPWAPPAPVAPTFRSPYGNPYQSSATAPVINNNITVQGNATPATAREIGTEAGRGTTYALGRDRSAIGAGFGVTP